MDRTALTELEPVPATVADLVTRAEALAAASSRTVLGIVGAPGAGKSTLCAALDEALGARAVVVGMDGFHLADEVLVELGRRARKGAPDTFDVAGYVSLLTRMRQAEEDVTYAPRFDRALEASIGSAVAVPRTVPLVITEGNYLLYDECGWGDVRPLLDEVWFLDLPVQERVRRLVARRLSHGDTANHAHSWVTEVDEANASLILTGREAANLVVRLVRLVAAKA
ncbi:nucleoside/nucleotide kinase family protein [Pengzhenrongella sicca]|uniref:Nucleoside/nucleotide kinase family protein n=1 Tax=Pengzhenrongella sicca TaxID=2819238 RepID=A0A8A4ZG90_9MICO|nr:nucleoside/nucleotide kinase family protein [Pengzhenrongella sicca]QTE31042.1 nucleoside/nucleotide kinase family protein [Pengzhenrongella sicca]